MNLIDVTRQFGTSEACNDFRESMRWPDGVECVHCASKRVTKYVKKASTRQRLNTKTGERETNAVPARILYVCLDCKKQSSIGEGTVFNDTHLSLDKWFLAVALMVNAKKGITLQLWRDVRMARKTAWSLNHRIRKAVRLVEAVDEEKLAGAVEADRTYVGGKYDARLYSTVAACIKSHNHETVAHHAKEWVRGDVHTGTIDGYWGLLKRGIIGSLHQVSIKHLHRYLSESSSAGTTVKHRVDLFSLSRRWG
jgi:DNA-directed RNA polymerase subunit RPC12/RpoP